MGEATLRSAVKNTMLENGVRVLGTPRTLVGILADALLPESVELGVLLKQCDEQWLSIYAEAAEKGTPEALTSAAERAGLLLAGQRAIAPQVAETVSTEMALGIADALGVSVGVSRGFVENSAAVGGLREPLGRTSASLISAKPHLHPPTLSVRDEIVRFWQVSSTRGRVILGMVSLASIVGVWAMVSMLLGLSSCVVAIGPPPMQRSSSGDVGGQFEGVVNDNPRLEECFATNESDGDSAKDATNVSRLIAIAAGGEGTVGLMSDGRIVATGQTEFEEERRVNDVSEWKNMTDVDRGETFILGLRATGKISTMGSNEAGQCNVGEWADVVAVAGGGEHTVAVLSDGTAKAAGSNADGQCDVGKWKDLSAVAAGKSHSLGLLSDGTVVATGCNDHKECDISDWEDVVEIAAGSQHSVARLKGGRVVAAGNNDHGQCNVEEWANIASIAAGANHTVALRTDGTVVATGDNRAGQCDVLGWKNVIAVAAGNEHTVGLCTDGTLLTTGSNAYGQLDVGGWIEGSGQ